MTFTMFGTAHLGQARCICSSNPEGCPLHQRVLPIDAPDRSVCQYTGELADGLSFPALVPDTNRAAFARAVGFYDCPCGSEFAIERRVILQSGVVMELAGSASTSPDARHSRGRKPDIEQLQKERDDAKAELDNMVDLTIEVGRLGNYLRHAIADRDECRERWDEWRDKAEMYLATIDELEAEVRELRGES